MISRNLLAGSVCLGCLVCGGISLSQERTRVARREQPFETNAGTLERRVVELERQLKSLTNEVDALRREVNPTAT